MTTRLLAGFFMSSHDAANLAAYPQATKNPPRGGFVVNSTLLIG